MYSVGHANSLVIISRESNFINFFDINLVTLTSYYIHFSMLFLPAKQTLSIVIELNTPFCNILCYSLTFFIRTIKHFVRVKFSSQTNKFNNPLPTSFILKHSKHFTIKSCFNSRWMVSWVVTSVKPFLNVGIDIFVEIFCLNFICERVSVGEELFCVIPIFSFNIVVMKVIHKDLFKSRMLIARETGLLK